MTTATQKIYDEYDIITFADFYEYESLLRIESGYAPAIMTPHEILDTFPEAVTLLKKTLGSKKEKLKKCEELCIAAFNSFLEGLYADSSIKEKERKELWIPMGVHIFYDHVVDPIKKNIKESEMIIKMSEMQSLPASPLAHLDLAMAKAYPISSLVKINHAGFASCPFHQEKTASMKVYKDNRFHCFGCGKDGDVVDFYMEQNGTDFKTSVAILSKR